MAGKSLQELDLKDEKFPELAYEDAPEFGGFAEPPQPGPKRFRIPADLSRVWEVYDVDGKGQRLRAKFDQDAPFVITQSTFPSEVNETFETRISNQERPRGKDKQYEVSDMDYLLKGLGETARPKGNRAYIDTLKKYAGKEFAAEVTFSFSCRKDKNIRVLDAAGKANEVENHPGCGKKYYQKDIASLKNGEGKYPTSINCECGANLRAFANLENFRP